MMIVSCCVSCMLLIQSKEWWLRVASDTISRFTPHVSCDDTVMVDLCEELYNVFSTGEAYDIIPGARYTIQHLSKSKCHISIKSLN